MTRKNNRYIVDIETSGLEALESRVLCICVNEASSKDILTISGEDESKLLREFWELMDCADKDDQIVGYGIDAFDIPFLIKRSIICKVPISKKYKTLKIVDLRKSVNSFFVSYNKFDKGKLSDWANVMGIPVKTEDGGHMPQFYADKNWKAIEEHCQEDVAITTKLYERLKEVNVL